MPPSSSSTRRLWFILTLLLALPLGGHPAAAQTSRQDPAAAEQAFLAGARFVDRKDLAGALQQFTRAVALNSAKTEYALALSLTREHRVSELVQAAARARLLSDSTKADQLLAEARVLDPANELVLQHTPQASLSRARVHPTEPLYNSPIQPDPIPGPKDLHVRGTAKQAVTDAALLFGLRAVFDDSVNSPEASQPPLRFDLDGTTYAESMPLLLRMAHLFAVSVDPKTLLIARDTQDNRKRLERQAQETLYVPGSNQEQLNELSNIIKNVFDVQQVVVGAGSGTLLLRAPEATLKAVNYTLADLLDGGAEVMMEIKLISIDKDNTHSTGVLPPTQFNAFSAAAELQRFVSSNQTAINTAISSGALVLSGSSSQMLAEEAAFLIVSGIATDPNLTNIIRFFGNGLTLFAVSTGSGASLNLALNTSEARALDDISVRVGDRQPATLRVGSRYPITTSTYSSGISNSTLSALQGKTVNGVPVSSLLQQYLGSASGATVPIIQYEDLGITLKATPTVLKSGLIRLSIDLKIEALTGASANNIPVLTSRAFTSDIMVEEGTSALMLSELSRSEAASVSGVPGLSELPGFRQTIGDDLREVSSSELILMVTPHLVRRRSSNSAGPRIAFSTSVPQEN